MLVDAVVSAALERRGQSQPADIFLLQRGGPLLRAVPVDLVSNDEVRPLVQHKIALACRCRNGHDDVSPGRLSLNVSADRGPTHVWRELGELLQPLTLQLN